MKVNMIRRIRNHSIFGEKEIIFAERAEEKLCSVIRLCLNLVVEVPSMWALSCFESSVKGQFNMHRSTLLKVAKNLNKYM